MPMSGFICHDDYLSKISKLSDEEVGRLFRALMLYHSTGDDPGLEGRESIAFDFIREDIDRAERAYKSKCDTNRSNRMSAIDNERKRTVTVVDDGAQKEKEKEKEKIKNKEKEKEKKIDCANKFVTFWDAYPRKVSKDAAQKAFEKLSPDDDLFYNILQAIQKQKQSEQWQEDGGQYIPYPATWLNQKRWQDEVKPAARGKVVEACRFDQRDYSEVPNEMLTELAEGIRQFREQGAG